MINKAEVVSEPIAYLVHGAAGVKMLVFADDITAELAKREGWRPLYDHLTDGETESLRIAKAVANDWERRYQELEKAGLETDRMVDELREQLSSLPKPEPVAVAPHVFRKGFNTLEQKDGKYTIKMVLASSDDAWPAFEELCRLTSNKGKELNP